MSAYAELLGLVNSEQDIASKQTMNQLRVAEIGKINNQVAVDAQSRMIARQFEEAKALQQQNAAGLPPPTPAGIDASPQLQAITAQINQAQQDYQMHTKLASMYRAGNGSAVLAEKSDDNARQARQDMMQGQLRLLQERKDMVKEVGAQAGTANEENFPQVRDRLDQLAPGWDRNLDVDFSPLNGGKPVWGPRTATAMQTVANASLTRYQQLEDIHNQQLEVARAESNDTQRAEIKSRDEERKSRDQARRDGIDLKERALADREAAYSDKASRPAGGRTPAVKEPTASEVRDIADNLATDDAFKDLKPADRRVAARDFAKYRNQLLSKNPDMDPDAAEAEAMASIKTRVKPAKEGTRTIANYLPFTDKYATPPEPARYVKGGGSTSTAPDGDQATMQKLDALGIKGSVSKGVVTGEGGAPVAITTDAQFNALPSGTVFVGPDGTKRRKP